jgi:hypothetical protein
MTSYTYTFTATGPTTTLTFTNVDAAGAQDIIIDNVTATTTSIVGGADLILSGLGDDLSMPAWATIRFAPILATTPCWAATATTGSAATAAPPSTAAMTACRGCRQRQPLGRIGRRLA